ncbi:putative inorganic phosphate cotransporter [Uloborus diversus]|uniref:putative inorganic phosphate cotransporter n=1 Tax=Uloborus diversus TaxID=327109 RepID=UPI00240A2317|nr:putative inorganic phosphate cotransporter [Uloborus diversus]
MTKEHDDEEPCFKWRYLISFMGFLTYFLLNAHRMNISVAVVAMVNHSTLIVYNDPHDLNATQPLLHNNSWNQAQIAITYDWSPQLQGYILGAGFFGYVFSLLFSGKLAETFGPKTTLASGTFVSSLAMLITPLTPAVHAYFLILIQCIRGIAQGFMAPSIAILSANWYPKAERALLAGIGFTGVQLGRLLGGILTGMICDSAWIGGWPSVFYIFGGFGICVSLFQVLMIHSMPKDHPRISRAELKCILANQENVLTQKRPPVPWKKLFTSLPMYALLIAMCGQYWATVYYTSSHAIFVADMLKYPISQNGLVVSVPYIIPLLLTPGVSYLSTWLSKNKYLSVDKVRKLWNFLGSLGFSICLTIIIATKFEKIIATVGSILGIAFSSVSIFILALVPVDMSPTFAGTLTGLSIGIACLFGFLCPIVCGALTNKEMFLRTRVNYKAIHITTL